MRPTPERSTISRSRRETLWTAKIWSARSTRLKSVWDIHWKKCACRRDGTGDGLGASGCSRFFFFGLWGCRFSLFSRFCLLVSLLTLGSNARLGFLQKPFIS